MVKVALGMIVKNEAHCIERCLDSVKPLIDFVCINDNGSTDGTQDKLIGWSEKNSTPVVILNNPWVSFDVNRSLVLSSIYEGWKDIDYVLMIDADEVLVFEAGTNIEKLKESLTCDLYDIQSRLGDTHYTRPQLTSNKKRFKYVGVVHETLQAIDEVKTRETIKGFFNYPIQDSARNKDPEKFKKDSEALLEAFNKETDSYLKARYCFYLAQCYKDRGDCINQSIETYLQVINLHGWTEEKYMALIQAGRMMRQVPLIYSPETILKTFLMAIEYNKNRSEALYEAMVTLKGMGLNYSAYLLGKEALTKAKPVGVLFLENQVYDYQIQFEMSIISWYAGDVSLGRDLTNWTIANSKCPKNIKDQAKANLVFYEKSASTPAPSAGT